MVPAGEVHALLYSDLSLDSGSSTLRRRHAAPAVADRRLNGPRSSEPAVLCDSSWAEPPAALTFGRRCLPQSPAVAGVSAGELLFAILVIDMLVRSSQPGLRRIVVQLVARRITAVL